MSEKRRKIDGLDIAIIHPVFGGTERKGSKSDYEEPEGTFGREIVTFGFGPKTRAKLSAFRYKVRSLCRDFGTPDAYVGGNYFVPISKLDELLKIEPELRKEYKAILKSAEDADPRLRAAAEGWDFFFHVTLFGLTPSIAARAERLVADSIEQAARSLERRLGKVATSSDEVRARYRARIDAMELSSSPAVQARLAALRAMVEEKTQEEAERARNVINALVEGGQKLYDQIVEAQASGWVSDELVAALESYQRKMEELGRKFAAEKDPRFAELVANLKSVAGAKA